MIATDVAVVGAGPAGLSAAIAAAEAGARVTVIDENPAPGGRLLGQLHQESDGKWWIGKDVAAELADRAAAAGVQLLERREVWGMYPQWKLALDGGETLAASCVVLASGAAERALPIPGWTLPGAMTIGAAQTLTNYYRVLPGKRVAVVGVDPLSLTVAHELTMAGAEVVGIYLPPADLFSKEKGDPRYTLGYLAGMADLAPNAFLRAGAKLAGVPALRKLAAALYPKDGIPVLGAKLKLRQRVSSIHGDDRVTGVGIDDVDRNGRPTGRSRLLEVDCVCLSGGLYPVQELTAGCSIERIDELGGQVPLHSLELETSRRNLFVAGNIAGIEGAKIAMAQGSLAGSAAAARLGLLDAAAVTFAAGRVGQARETSSITFQPDILQGRRRATESWARTVGEMPALSPEVYS
jgi:sarcosine oxidase subunit alpha